MQGESGVTRSVFDEIPSCDMEGEQKDSESRVTRSIIDDLISSYI